MAYDNKSGAYARAFGMDTVADAESFVLTCCPGGHIVHSSAKSGWWALDNIRYPDGSEGIFITWDQNSKDEALEAVRKGIKKMGATLIKHEWIWLEEGPNPHVDGFLDFGN